MPVGFKTFIGVKCGLSIELLRYLKYDVTSLSRLHANAVPPLSRNANWLSDSSAERIITDSNTFVCTELIVIGRWIFHNIWIQCKFLYHLDDNASRKYVRHICCRYSIPVYSDGSDAHSTSAFPNIRCS